MLRCCAMPQAAEASEKGKSFLVLFFKKERLPFRLPYKGARTSTSAGDIRTNPS